MLRRIYYYTKPLIPRPVQIALRRMIVKRKRYLVGHIWPIDPASAEAPSGWTGWPFNKQFALLLTHDVDTMKGQNQCSDLMNLEIEKGFRSSFNFVPELYPIDDDLVAELIE